MAARAPDLPEVVGARMRGLRDVHGVTADMIATHARRMGLGWQRSTVASIETGKRGLTAEELLLLPLILSMALPVAVSIRDLLDRDVAITDEVVMTPSGFRHWLDEDTPIWGGYKLTSREADTQNPARQPSVQVWRRIEELWPEVHGDSKLDLARLRMVERDAAGEAEQNAARSLGVSALDVTAVAHRLWNHSLTAERERRVELEVDSSDSATAMRVKRGHVTRALLEEIAAILKTS